MEFFISTLLPYRAAIVIVFSGYFYLLDKVKITKNEEAIQTLKKTSL